MSSALLTETTVARIASALAEKSNHPLANFKTERSWDLGNRTPCVIIQLLDAAHIARWSHKFEGTEYINVFQQWTIDRIREHFIEKWPEVFKPRIDPVQEAYTILLLARTELQAAIKAMNEKFETFEQKMTALAEVLPNG